MKRFGTFVLAGIFVFIVFLVFPVSHHGGFVSDDWDWLMTASQNTGLSSIFFLNTVGQMSGGSYNPISSLWIYVLYKNFGLNPIPYHYASLLLHAFNALLLARLTGLILDTFFARKSRSIPVAIGTLFLLWPTHVEAVQWIAAVPHLLSTCFMLLALMTYISRRSRVVRRGTWLVVLYSLCAFLSKETALSLPIILCVFESWYQRVHLKKMSLSGFLTSIVVALTAVGCLALRFFVTGLVFSTYAAPLALRPWQWANTFFTCFEEFFTMGTLRTEWMWWFWANPVVLTVAGAALMLFIIWLVYRSHNITLQSASLILFASLAPFLALGFNRLSSEGERYTYLPSVFFLMLMGIAASEFMKRFGRLIFILLLIAALPILSQKNEAWLHAFQAADMIVAQAAQLPHMRDANHLFVFVGLPDTLSGAQVFRNNFNQALSMTAPGLAAKVAALPVYTQYEISDEQTALLAWTYDERGLYARNRDHRLVVTGADRKVTELLTYELWGYDYNFFSSDMIRLLYGHELKNAVAQGSASIISWQDGVLQDVTHTMPEPTAL